MANEPYVRNQLYSIPLAELREDPDQPRKFFDPLKRDELAASIARNGVLEPILFRVENGINYVVAGRRRCIAALQAGLTSIPAICIDGQNHEEIALVENLQRQDLNPVEEAEALGLLQEVHQYQQEDLMRIFGKSKTYVSETLSLNRLPQAIRDECRQDPTIPKHTLVEIVARNKQERSMTSAFAEYKAEQQKATAEKTQAVRRTKAESFAATLATTEDKIAKLNLETIAAEEKSIVIKAVDSLRQTINAFFDQVAQ